MTLISKLGYKPVKSTEITVPSVINVSEISIVVPVKNNQAGITRLLSQLEFVCSSGSKPREVIVVDNNSSPSIILPRSYSFPVTLKCCSIVGPAAARNLGAKMAVGDWLLFIDSDCLPTENTLAGYKASNNKHVAYAGNVRVTGEGIFEGYYSSQETLLPPEAIDGDIKRPDYLVTANCLVSKSAFLYVGGFDESFPLAGGEDIDLGFRLLTIGSLAYQWNSVVEHTFSDGLTGFVSRFNRYGKGNKLLSVKYNLDLRPAFFIPNRPSMINILLSILQKIVMHWGYMRGDEFGKAYTSRCRATIYKLLVSLCRCRSTLQQNK